MQRTISQFPRGSSQSPIEPFSFSCWRCSLALVIPSSFCLVYSALVCLSISAIWSFFLDDLQLDWFVLKRWENRKERMSWATEATIQVVPESMFFENNSIRCRKAMVTDSVSEIQRSRDISQHTSLKSDSNERFEQASRTKKSNQSNTTSLTFEPLGFMLLLLSFA